MKASHSVSPVFDDPNLVSCGGLVPVLALADRCGLHSLVADTLTLSGPGSANADLKVPALVAAMIAGADSIDDMDLLRHGGMGRVFGGIRAPSTLGTFLRTFTFGHVRQLDAVAARLLINLADHTPLLPDAETVTFVDIDDTVKRTYGYAKQGAGYGYSGVKGLNALIGAVSTPTSAPVIAATRLRKGSTNSARGAARLVADTLSVGGLGLDELEGAVGEHGVVGNASSADGPGTSCALAITQLNALTTRSTRGGASSWSAVNVPAGMDTVGDSWLAGRLRGKTHPMTTARSA